MMPEVDDAQRVSVMRKALRSAVWSLGTLVLLVVLAIGAVLVAGNTAGGRALIERTTARLTDGKVQLIGLGGSFPSQIELGRLQLSDDEGVWLTADHISLSWSPLDMIEYYVKAQSVHVARLDIVRRPVNHSPSHGEAKVPEIDVGQFSIDVLALEPQLVGIKALLWIRGSGHLESLSDARLQVVARRWDRNGDYEVQLAFDPARMDATLKLEEPAGGPLQSLAQVPGLGALEVTGSLTGPRSAEKVELNARAGELQTRIAGTLDLRDASVNLQYTLESGPVAPRPEIAWQHLQLQGRWVGSLRAPQAASGHLSADGLQLPDRARLASLDASLSAAGATLSLDATASGLEVPNMPRELLQTSRLHATLQLDDRTRPLQLLLQQRLFALKAEGTTAGARSAKFTLTLPDLAPFAVLAKQPKVRGSATVSGKVAQSAAAIRLDADAAATLTAPSMWARLLGPGARLRFGASVTDRSIDVDRLTLTGKALTLSASGSGQRVAASGAKSAGGSAPGTIRGKWSLEIPDLAALSPDIRGKLKVTGQLAGVPRALGADLQAVTTLSVRDSAPGSLTMNVQARGLPSAPSAAIQAQGSFNGSPVQLDAFLGRGAADTYHLEIRRTDWKSAHLEANLETGANLSEGRGSLQLRIGQLADLEPLIGKPIQGSLTGNLALHADGRRTHVQLQLDAHDLTAGDVSGEAKLSGSGPIDAVRLQLSAQSPDLRGKPVSLTAAAQLNVSDRVLELAATEANYHGQSLRLLAPARITFANGLQVSEVRLGMQHAVLELAGEVFPDLHAHASLHGIDAALVNSFAPNFLTQGTLSADARLEGTVAAPSGHVSLRMNALRFGDPGAGALPPLDLHADAQLMGTTAKIDAALSAGTSQLKLTGQAPLNMSSTVDLSLSGKIDAAFANAFLEAHGERAAGTLTVDATVTGPAQTAEIGGSIQLDHGDIRDYAQGVHFGDIAAHIVGGQGILKIGSLTARAGSGQVAMTGTFGVLQHKMPIDLKLTAKNAQPITNDIVTTNVDADMSLKGTLRERMDVAGTIHVNRAVIGIPNSLPPNVQVLNVIRPGQAPPAPAERRVVIGLNITLDAPRNIRVQGRGLNAELGGDVRIHGTTEQPAVSGSFSLIRGTFALASTQLNFTMGDVSFNGAGLHGRIDPTLDFLAQASAADATVNMHITGFADSPQFELTSTPPLPQDEILARLLFGETASQLSAVQLAQIGAALVTMTGVGGSGINPLEKIQRALGLNVLTVGSAPNSGVNQNQNNGASLTAGRYVTNRVFVAGTQSTTGVSQLLVDVDLTKHLKLQTRLGNGTATAQGVTPENDPGSSIGLTYQFQY
jgi:translocation and assembly module TamB